MQRFPISPLSLIGSYWRHRELIAALAKREITARYKGSLMGILWSLITPIFMLGVYTFVFSVVFQSRWDVTTTSKTEFALVLFIGLIVFNLFSECISRAPTLILQNPNYVKKVVFPLEILPGISLATALFQGCVNLLVWTVFYWILIETPHLQLVLCPLILLPLLLAILGTSWLLASLGTFLRDLSQVIGLALSVLLFLSPIFYPASALPKQYRPLLDFNPLSLPIEQSRALLLHGDLPSLPSWGIQLAISAVWAWACYVWFQKSRRAFADVI